MQHRAVRSLSAETADEGAPSVEWAPAQSPVRTHLRVIRELETDVSQIASMLDLARPTVSIHCKQLREAGLIDSRKQGRRVVHSIRAAELRRLFSDLEAFLGLPTAGA